MYNVSKGENTLEESETLELLHKCLREAMDLEKRGLLKNVVYTDHDVAAATLMYSHVLGNRLIHTLMDERTSIRLSQHLGKTYGEAIHLLTRQMSGVDINITYNQEDSNGDTT